MLATRHLAIRVATMTAGTLALSLVVGTAPAAGAGRTLVSTKGALRDYSTATVGPFDNANARVKITRHKRGSTVMLRLSRISRSAAGDEFGAHLHTGPCVTNDPLAAGGHYNTDVIAGRTPTRVNRSTEVWLDFVVTRSGKAKATAKVPFTPVAGTRSIVVHKHATRPDGTAGGRLACLPVVW